MMHVIETGAHLNVDEKRHVASGTAFARFSTLRADVTQVQFETTADRVWDVRIDGSPAKWTKSGGRLRVDIPASRSGAVHALKLAMEGGIFAWYAPNRAEPSKVGFWGEGSRALPLIWGYANDFSASELALTVPTAWSVFSNGKLISDVTVASGRHTVLWRMDQPHASYLNAVAAGPFDIQTGMWRNVPLIFTCPKGYGDRLDYAFTDTKDILDYFTAKLGVPYPWAKYGQHVIYDHPYGEENVSATFYPMFWGRANSHGSLSTDREWQDHGFEWVIAHETAHQWWGDFVTYKDYGDIWLNEGFATFMEMIYTLHSRGTQESLREIEDYSQRYFTESRTRKQPVTTKYYGGVGIGTAHIYQKAGVLLMSLRAKLGDELFFRGLSRYLTHRGPGNAETNDLIEDITDATGINVHPWFDQWILKPGHPVLAWSYEYRPDARQLALTVKQTQDTSNGTPIYVIDTHIGVITDAGIRRIPIHLSEKEQTITLPLDAAPRAVAMDPDHEILREIPEQPWVPDELPYILRFDPNPADRLLAMNRMADTSPSEETLRAIAAVLLHDTGRFPAIVDASHLARLNAPALKEFWIAETLHANYQRRATAAEALGPLAETTDDIALLKRLLGDAQPYPVVAAAIRALAVKHYAEVRDFARAMAATSPSREVRQAALETLAGAQEPGWEEAMVKAASEENPVMVRAGALEAMRLCRGDDPRVIAALRSGLACSDYPVSTAAARTAAAIKATGL
jgi:aminopeptidase N